MGESSGNQNRSSEDEWRCSEWKVKKQLFGADLAFSLSLLFSLSFSSFSRSRMFLRGHGFGFSPLSGFMRPLRLGFSFCSFSFFSFALSLPPQSSQDGGENTTSKNGGRKVAIFLH
jgi:hypothetical protein